jgi:hypothetical protein
MKRNYRLLLAAAIVLVSGTVFFACKKPVDDFNYVINSSVFNYTASLRFRDPASNNAVPANITVAVQGAIASQVYDLSGFKALSVSPEGIVSFGLTQQAEPVGAATVPVTLLVTVPGFRAESVTVVFDSKSKNLAVQTVDLLSLTKPSDGVSVKVETLPVTGGTVPAPVSVATPVGGVSGSAQASTVTLPANTQLRDAAGAVVNTSSISVYVANADVEKPKALDFIPNSSLVQTAIVNGVSQPVVFAPASITNIEIFAANGTPITNFSQPIMVTAILDPTTNNPNTGQPIKAGDALDYYSYTVATNTWKYESSGVVVLTNGVLSTVIPVTHLSSWMSSVKSLVSKLCSNQSIEFSLNGSNFTDNGTDLYDFQFYSKDLKKILKIITKAIKKDDVLTLTGITTGEITLTVLGPLGNVVGTASINCGATNASVTINIPQATAATPTVTITVTAKCASGNLKPGYTVTAPGGTVVLYRKTGTTAWDILGSTTTGGQLITTLLDKALSYDFQTTVNTGSGPVTKMVTGQGLNALLANTDFKYTQVNDVTGTITYNYTVRQSYCQ